MLTKEVRGNSQRGSAVASAAVIGVCFEPAVLARLAASYLLAGDAETARRYVGKAQDLFAAGDR